MSTEPYWKSEFSAVRSYVGSLSGFLYIDLTPQNWHRFLGQEEQKQSLVKENVTLQHRIQELEAGLQELGREHQTLQIVHSRQSQRKWEKDSEVSNCTACKKKFSVNVRRVSYCNNILIVFVFFFVCLLKLFINFIDGWLPS